MTLRHHRGDRLAWMRSNNARSVELCGMWSGRDCRMALIVVKRKRRIFRRHLHVARLLGGWCDVMLICCGQLLRCRLRGRAAGAAIVADVGCVVDDDRLVVDVGDRDVRNVVH
jgi:hypothetical protein